MQYPIYLPNVELNMEGVTVTSWLVKIGDRVEAEQPLLEVETQKATIEVPSSDAGYVRALYVAAGDEVAERALLCVLTDAADEPFDDPRQSAAASSGARPRTSPTANEAPAVAEGGIMPAAPAARKLAKELGVDLALVKGSGPGGRITTEDVQSAAQRTPAASGDASRDEGWTQLPASRLALNGQMQKSLAEIPQIHVARQMDVTPLCQKQQGVTFTHRLVKAVAAALQKHPALRTVIEGNRIKETPVSVAVAMDTPHGLVAPALRHAEALSLEAIATTLQEFQQRGASNALKREELSNAPFAITNLGMFGVDFFQAFVFHGQTAVLAVGRATESGNGNKIAWFNLASDHRVVDGAEGARFLETLQQEINRS